MASLGQELKRERELRSISLQDIAAQTKIGVRHLQALEEDRLDLLPGKFLTKAILRSYAKALGIDEDRIMNKFHEEVLAQEQAGRPGERSRASVPREPAKPAKPAAQAREPRIRIGLISILIVVIVIAVLAGLYFFVIAPKGASKPESKPPAAVETSKTEPEAKTPAAEFPQLPPVVAANEPSQTGKMRLEFEFTAPTWMHVAADGALVFEGTQPTGTRATVEAATEVVLQTGNAAGFRLRINGRPVRPLGKSGQVLTDVRIRRDNLELFLEGGK